MIVCIFIKLILLGVVFLNRTGAEIGYYLHKKCKNIIFYYLKNKKIPKVLCSAIFSFLEPDQDCHVNSHLCLHKKHNKLIYVNK